MTDISKLAGLKVGAAVCGSFCTFSRVFRVLSELTAAGCDITPIMSDCAYHTDTRFGRAQEHAARLFDITGKTVLHEITTTEPIGPRKMFDVLLVAPCTGNTLAKLALGITDTSVTMAAKAHLRCDRPLVIALATNDAMSANFKNIAALIARKCVYFVPMKQDDPVGKPHSLVADFALLPETLRDAENCRQTRRVFI